MSAGSRYPGALSLVSFHEASATCAARIRLQRLSASRRVASVPIWTWQNVLLPGMWTSIGSPRLPIEALKLFIAFAYIARALSRLKPAAICTPQSLTAARLTRCSSWVTKGLGERLSDASKSWQLVFGLGSGIFPFLLASAQSSTLVPVMAAT